ncbi:UvrD-helicase domain-containing protein [Achromobacter sp. SIMBA_011]|jgi:ATP-dependent DNA helicase Rep|uniref:ATP-dependent DNA helicase Rep n=1 Tax=Achromobacter ruhlandii TaxID=72557 RepID=A0A2M9GTL4_9BURK|nr:MULTISPECIES: UvrD-helicase domain-containing protein [Achromobacter]ALX82073.1 ATP-dependent DNA helicase Rep [Achromobacter denitrificans]MBQ2646743.1 UvrD-helicase domain-containing protein [Achromobacter sp.]OAS84644.1 ATP-dependent DNA helicase Rep [Achromobacter xylosoxidans]MCI1838918.1 UvrD-helicase domain-containing protein [Achromobacter ruhlandii]MCV6797121.1 UvrD-helicase domain-containing protein [Achromobacter ruhlandii]
MSAHEPIGHGLNPAQKEAVLYLDGPCLVLAGAGSGKTRVITQKIAYLLRECGYMGRNVVALTFTNKAAREMDERVKTLVDRKLGKGLTISTFHSLGVKLLREEARNAGLKPTFSILDADDAMAIIQELLATTDKGRLRHVQGIISLWKNALMEPDDAAREAITPGDVEAANVYRSYAATLAAYQAVDFDDLIRIPAILLANNEEVRTRWQNRVRYLLVDEYQDTNVCQYRLVQLLTGPRAMFTAVGDDDQAIYAWRGATIENLAKLTTDYPNLKLIKLEQNYRSVQRILAAANQVIEKNPKLFEKKLWSDLGVGEPIVVSAMDGEEHEAESIAMKISASRFERQAQWKDFAILYRGNHQSRILEQALRNLKIPYTIAGGQSFFDKAEVRDILAYLRLLANDEDDPAFIRAATTPKRGIGQATLQTLGQYAATRELSLLAAVDETGLESLLAPRQLEPLRTFTEFIRRMQWRAGRGATAGTDGAPAEPAGVILDDLVQAIQYERHLFELFDERPAQTRWQNVLELTGWLKRKAEEDNMSLFELVQHVALVTMLERGEEEEPDAVKMSTLHASKGLEYPHVYLAGVEEGLLPHLGKDDEVGDPARAAENLATRIQEERRLMYVGITRAQRSLNLSWCKRRRRAREDLVREPSRFIEEMGLDAPGIQEDETTAAMNPKERMAMLKALLKK